MGCVYSALECSQISLQPTFTFSTLSHLLLIFSYELLIFYFHFLSVCHNSIPPPPFPSHFPFPSDYCCGWFCNVSIFPFLLLTNIVLFYLFFVNTIKFISRSGLHMDNFCPLSNPFQHECISAPSIKSSSQIIEKSCCPHLVLVQFECNCTCAYFLLCAIIDIHHLIDALIE